MKKSKTAAVVLPEWLADRGWKPAQTEPQLRGAAAITAVNGGTHRVCLKHDQYGWMVAASDTKAAKQTLCWIERVRDYQAMTGAQYALMNALQYIGGVK